MKKERIHPDKAAYLIYADWMQVLMETPADLRHKITDALFAYCLYGEEPENLSVASPMFALMKLTLDKDNESYKEKVRRVSEKRKEAAKKGGAPIGNTNASKKQPKTTKNNQNNQNNQNNPDNDTVSDTVSVSVSDTVELIEHNKEDKNINTRARKVDFFEQNENNETRINWNKFKQAVLLFGKENGIPDEECERFYEYTCDNSCVYADTKGVDFYTREGEVIDNWQGAFVRFSNTVYDRKAWLLENGMKPGDDKKKYSHG